MWGFIEFLNDDDKVVEIFKKCIKIIDDFDFKKMDK